MEQMERTRTVDEIIDDFARRARNKNLGIIWEAILTCPNVRTCKEAYPNKMICYDGWEIHLCGRWDHKEWLAECPMVKEVWNKILR